MLNVLSPRDLVSGPDIMDETVPHNTNWSSHLKHQTFHFFQMIDFLHNFQKSQFSEISEIFENHQLHTKTFCLRLILCKHDRQNPTKHV